jgi:8-oxo-dGTP diphosphatase
VIADTAPLVRAAGGIILRDGGVLLIHRPGYEDWSFPKGKLHEGEAWEDAALREVEEETGLRCELGAHAATTRYFDRFGRDKEVRYFLMDSNDEPAARNEVDEVRWVPLEEAAELLSYERDRELVSRLR